MWVWRVIAAVVSDGHVGHLPRLHVRTQQLGAYLFSDQPTWHGPAHTHAHLFCLLSVCNQVRSASFSPDTRMAISGGDDKTVSDKERRTKREGRGTPPFSMRCHVIHVMCAVLCGHLAVPTVCIHQVRVWDVERRDTVETFYEHQETVCK